MLIKSIKSIVHAIKDLIDHEGVEHAGYLSFLLMLTIFPFLFFLTAIAGFFGDEKLAHFLIDSILRSSWAQFIDALKPRIIELVATPPQNLLTIAVVSAIWTASSFFEAIRTALNKAYRVTSTPSYLLRRLLSFIEFFVTISITIGLILVLIVIPSLLRYFSGFLNHISIDISSFVTPEVETLRNLIMALVTLMMVAGAYHTLPNRKGKFRRSLPGAIIVVFAWYMFSFVFKYYLFHSPQVNVIYGSITSIIIALLYFYFCSLIFIFGAEFNYQIEKRFKSKGSR